MIAADHTPRIIFAGGGTGGHLFPALAIADRIRELLADRATPEILFVGTTRGIEYRMRDRLGYPLTIINVRGLVRSFTLKNLLVPFVLASALFRAWLLLRRFRPDLVVGTGGYVALPILKAAAWRDVPTVLQEQNSFPGITTRLLAGRARQIHLAYPEGAARAKKIYLGFEGARAHLKTGAEMVVTGNPVRRSITGGDRNKAITEFRLDPNKKTILVLGGSQGARAVNRAVLKSITEHGLPEHYQLLWQTGKRDYKDVVAMAGSKVTGCTLFPFAHNMETVYAAADLAIARAGALTLAELTACRLPSILIPYPHAAGDHQRKNAEELAGLGAARVIEETKLETTDLLAEASALLDSPGYREMAAALLTLSQSRRPAVDVIAEDIIALIERRQKATA